VGDRNGLLLVDTNSPEDLMNSRIAEDIFSLVVHTRGLERNRQGLARLTSLVRSAPGWDSALRLHAGISGGRGRRKVSTYRVVSRTEGRYGFRRKEAEEAVAAGLAERLGRRWKLVPENAQVEVWLTMLGAEALVGLRLTTAEQRQRGKTAHVPASLRPSVAAALVRLTNPEPEDVFLDPFCGAGTILVERAHAERHRLILGGDTSEEALGASRENIGPRHKPLELHRWDAKSIPLESGSVSAIATNPPFGRQLGSREENEVLYPAFLQEAHRLLRPNGRLVVLTPETRIMRRELTPPRWKTTDRITIQVLGRRATIYSALRRP
jgi:tRNA (guanine6-N2)-methyltransferase